MTKNQTLVTDEIKRAREHVNLVVLAHFERLSDHLKNAVDCLKNPKTIHDKKIRNLLRAAIERNCARELDLLSLFDPDYDWNREWNRYVLNASHLVKIARLRSGREMEQIELNFK